MAYEVTATRRRPQQFSDLTGQDFVAETLKNSIKTRQIAHAYLFAGPRGCGKTSTARILAKALNCQNSEGPTTEPCGQCESCRAITNSSSLDVIEIDGASNTSVNDVRQIKDEVMFPPSSCRYKIYIIDEVHMLSTSAFNALLKTIEEPPAHVIFIFATTELQKVPATIKSRCQQYNFRLVSVEKLKNLLADACAELNIQADDEALFWIAKESGGSVRDAYTLFDQVAAFSENHMTYEKIRDKLGLLGTDRLNSIFEACAQNHSDEVLNQLDQFLQSGISIEQLISNSSEYLRSLLLIKNGITKESLLGQSAERFSQTVLNFWNTVQVERAVSIFLNLYRDIRYSVSPRYELELAFSRLCWLSQYVSPAEVKTAIDSARTLLSGAPATASAPEKTPVQNSQISGETVQANPSVQQNVPDFSQMKPVSKPENFSQTTAAVSEAENQPSSSYENSSQAENSSANQENPYSTQNGLPPKGVPTFSALEKVHTPPEDATQEQNPFNNGGALPPEQSAAARTSEKADYFQAQPVQPVQSVKTDIEPPVPDEYEPAPDDEYPPDTDFQPESEASESAQSEKNYIQEKIQESYAQEAAQEDSVSSEDVHQNDETYEAPDGTKITMTKIFGQVISELSINDALIASSLLQTGAWHLTGNKIYTTISNVYQKTKIEQNVHKINALLESICHSKMIFEVQLVTKKAAAEKAPEDIPQQVKILCSVFKGNIQGGKD